jgi:hypothetical protein
MVKSPERERRLSWRSSIKASQSDGGGSYDLTIEPCSIEPLKRPSSPMMIATFVFEVFGTYQ